MPVGNDVVDLRDPDSESRSLHPGWDARVFTRSERLLVESATDAHRMRWAMWAAKESAFKAASRMDHSVRFLPRTFVVLLAEGTDGPRPVDGTTCPSRFIATHEGTTFDVLVRATDDLVHAVATLRGSSPAESTVTPLAFSTPDASTPTKGGPVSPSTRVREVAREAIAGALTLPPAEVDISPTGRPVARRAGADLPIVLSLSHHGRFVACAWGPPLSNL